MILSFDTITNLKLIFEFKRKVWEILRVNGGKLAMARFLALIFNRRTEVEFCTSVDTKPFSPPIANFFVSGSTYIFPQISQTICFY